MVVQETRTKHAEDGWWIAVWKNLPRAPHPNPRTMKHNQRDGRGDRVPAAVHVHGVSLVGPGRLRGHGLRREMELGWQKRHLLAAGGGVFIGRRCCGGHGFVPVWMHRNGEIGLGDRRDRNKEKETPWECWPAVYIRDCVIGGQMLALQPHGHRGGTLEIEQVEVV